jgi:hypothetical protein
MVIIADEPTQELLQVLEGTPTHASCTTHAVAYSRLEEVVLQAIRDFAEGASEEWLDTFRKEYPKLSERLGI